MWLQVNGVLYHTLYMYIYRARKQVLKEGTGNVGAKKKRGVCIYNGNNLMTCASKLKVDRGTPGEPILYLSGKYHM